MAVPGLGVGRRRRGGQKDGMSKQSQLNGFIRSVPQPKHKGKKRGKKIVRGEKRECFRGGACGRWPMRGSGRAHYPPDFASERLKVAGRGIP